MIERNRELSPLPNQSEIKIFEVILYRTEC